MVDLSRILRCFLSAAVVCLAVTAKAEMPDTKDYTAIHVTDMHCMSCAKKIAARLYPLSGVLRVHADVEKDIAYVVPQKTKSPSPKAMWEAVEKAGFKPLSMSGPGGKFTSKPKT